MLHHRVPRPLPSLSIFLYSSFSIISRNFGARRTPYPFPSDGVIIVSEATEKHTETPVILQNLIEARKVYRDFVPNRMGETEMIDNLDTIKMLSLSPDRHIIIP